MKNVYAGNPYSRPQNGGFGDYSPMRERRHDDETPKGTSLRESALFEPLCVFFILRRLSRPVRAVRASENREIKKNKQGTRTLYLMHMPGRHRTTDCNQN